MIKKILIPAVLATSFCISAENELRKNNNTDNNAPNTLIGDAGCPPKEDKWFLETDLLYWIAEQEGNTYASTGTAITVPGTPGPGGGDATDILQNGQLYAPKSCMNPGVRIGGGINLGHGNWDIYAEYTFFFDKAQGDVSSTDLNAGIFPIFAYTPTNSILTKTTAFGGVAGFVSKASSYWSLRLNNINWELGQNMSIGQFLCLHPHFGLQATFQNQLFNAYYTVTSLTNFDDILGSNEVLFEQSFWGLGLRGGVDSVWRCIDHLSLYFNPAVAVLWGEFMAQARSYDTNNSAYSNVLIADTIYSPHTLSPVLELAAGLQGDWTFDNHKRLLVKAGFEQQIWFYQNQHSSTVADTSLVIQGLTIKCRVDY